MKDAFVQISDIDGNPLTLEARIQVVGRHHQYEGMVGTIEAITSWGGLKLTSRSGTKFISIPSEVRLIESQSLSHG